MLAGSRIIEKRKEWLASVSMVPDKSQIKDRFGPHWWYFMGQELLDVIMPVEYYQVRKNGELGWDDLGRTAYEADLQRYHYLQDDEDKVRESLYPFFYAQGKIIFGGETNQANDYAMNRIGYSLKIAPPIDPQQSLDLNDPKQSNAVVGSLPSGNRGKIRR